MRLMKVVRVFYFSTAVAGIVMGIMSPVRRLFYPSWYPTDYRKSDAAYYSWSTLQGSCSFFIALSGSTLDLYAPALYALLGAHIRVLRKRLANIGNTNIDGTAADASRKADGFNGTGSEKSVREAADRRELASCVDYHNMCIE